MQEKILLLQENLTNIKEQKATLEAELAFKETEVKDLIAERDWLSELVDINIVTYNEDRKCFTPDLQQCVYGLLNCNVSCSQITPVIQHALQLSNRQANKLPSRSTVNNMNVQRLVLSHRQLSEEFKEKQNTCLLGDETSKYGHKYQGIHSSDADGRIWALGVREMTTKAGQSVLNVLKDILSDIDDASERSDNEVSKEILLNISSTMSDRAATQLKFNELLEEFRTSVLKEKMVDTWETLSLNEQETISKLSNFFCSLHLLVHMAEAAASTLKESDKGFFGTEHPILDKSFLKATEPGAVRLIRIASKAFARGGDEKNGAHLHFETYIDNFLATHKLRSIPLERYRGNRFNIIFSAASNVFFLADKMSAYLEAGASNRLLLALQFDLQIPEYVAGCKALGLISEFITIPLWCCLEDSNISIMDIGVHFKELVAYLEEMDYQKFVEGKYLMTRVDRQKVLNSRIVLSLVKPWEHDDKVHVILQMIIPALTGVVKRLLADHLVGGKWNNPTEDQKYKTLATPKHNKFCESVFGYLDRFIREKPNSTVLAMESYVLFCHNKTLEWLSNKPAGERHSLLEMARKDEKKMREKFKARKKVIELERQQILQEKIQETERKKEARLKKVEHYTNQVLIWGLWQSEEEVDQALLGLKTKKDKIEAITAQLNFRKHVLKQTVDDQSDVYNQSSIVNGKRQKFTIDKFTSNIKKLVRRAYTIQINENDNDTIIVGKKVKHGFEESAETKWYFGQVISQVTVIKIRMVEVRVEGVSSNLKMKNSNIKITSLLAMCIFVPRLEVSMDIVIVAVSPSVRSCRHISLLTYYVKKKPNIKYIYNIGW
ncbi:uncharacterized protein [Mytilus edulis]|uniref:uncharacterized protein n=1 Tax=Mytilus edulis TaxID=6550 RepID=UPI0039EFE6DC